MKKLLCAIFALSMACQAINAGFVFSGGTVAQLLTTPPTTTSTNVYVTGVLSDRDGKGGFFSFYPSSSQPTNSNDIFNWGTGQLIRADTISPGLARVTNLTVNVIPVATSANSLGDGYEMLSGGFHIPRTNAVQYLGSPTNGFAGVFIDSGTATLTTNMPSLVVKMRAQNASGFFTNLLMLIDDAAYDLNRSRVIQITTASRGRIFDVDYIGGVNGSSFTASGVMTANNGFAGNSALISGSIFATGGITAGSFGSAGNGNVLISDGGKLKTVSKAQLQFHASTDGVVALRNFAGTDFTRLNFGDDTTNSASITVQNGTGFPAGGAGHSTFVFGQGSSNIFAIAANFADIKARSGNFIGVHSLSAPSHDSYPAVSGDITTDGDFIGSGVTSSFTGAKLNITGDATIHSVVYTWPSSAAAGAGYVLADVAGNGTLSWQPPSGGATGVTSPGMTAGVIPVATAGQSIADGIFKQSGLFVFPLTNNVASNGSSTNKWSDVETMLVNGATPGTVTSVAATVPSDLSVAGSPVTSSGTLAITRLSQAANLFMASPDGSSGVPVYRAIASADILAGVLLTNAVSTGSGTVSNALTVVNNAGDLVATLGAPAGTNPTHELRGNVYINSNGTNTLGKLGIGTATPTSQLHIVNTNNAANITVKSFLTNSVSILSMAGDLGSGYSTALTFINSAPSVVNLTSNPNSGNLNVGVNASGLFIGTLGNAPVILYTGGTASSNERMRILGTGGINMTGPLVVTNTGLSIGGASYTWPGAVGSAGSVLTDAGGNGTLSWVAASGGSINGLTANVIPVATSATSLGNGIFEQIGQYIIPLTNNNTFTGSSTNRWAGISSVLGDFSGALTLNTVSYTFPGTVGSAGYILTDVAGNGTLSWQPPSGGSSGVTSSTLTSGVVPIATGAHALADGIFKQSGLFIFPLTNNVTSSGSSTNKWSDVETVLLNGATPGTVTSVAATVPSDLSVSGSPVTTSGTLAITRNSQSQNLFLASPNGSSGTPSYRAIVSGDLPSGSVASSTLTSGVIPVATGSASIGDGIIQQSQQYIIPLTNNNTFAGSSTNRWAGVSSVLGNFSGALTLNTVAYTFPGTVGGAGTVLTDAAGNGTLSWGAGAAGSVTSVAATVPSDLSVAGSPITTSGTLAITRNSQSQNLFLASPNGSSGTPSYRAIVSADLPGATVTASTLTSGIIPVATGAATLGDGILQSSAQYVLPRTNANTFLGSQTNGWQNVSIDAGTFTVTTNLPGLYVRSRQQNSSGVYTNAVIYVDDASQSSLGSSYILSLITKTRGPVTTFDETGLINAAAITTSGVGTFTGGINAGGSIFSGKIVTYNNISTASGGIPSELGTADITAQTAAKTATTLYTPAANGMFRVSVVLQVTTAGTTSVLGGTTGVVITYTEPDGSVAQSVTMALDDQAGSVITPATGNTGNSTTTSSHGQLIIQAKSGVAVQYAIGYASTGTAMQYSAHLKIEAL